jgi:hypothetical protein
MQMLVVADISSVRAAVIDGAPLGIAFRQCSARNLIRDE